MGGMRPWIVLGAIGLLISCSEGRGARRDRARGSGTVHFGVLGDTPYLVSEVFVLRETLAKVQGLEFLLHVGDMRDGPCSRDKCKREDLAWAGMFFFGAGSVPEGVQCATAANPTPRAPIFLVPGDNETIDCAGSYEDSLDTWRHALGCFEKRFQGGESFAVKRDDPAQSENFWFVRGDTLFVGLYLVSSNVCGSDFTTCSKKLPSDSQYVDWCDAPPRSQLANCNGLARMVCSAVHFLRKAIKQATGVRKIVIFAQAPLEAVSPVNEFFCQLDGATEGLDVLYIHGDAHNYRLLPPRALGGQPPGAPQHVWALEVPGGNARKDGNRCGEACWDVLRMTTEEMSKEDASRAISDGYPVVAIPFTIENAMKGCETPNRP